MRVGGLGGLEVGEGGETGFIGVAFEGVGAVLGASLDGMDEVEYTARDAGFELANA